MNTHRKSSTALAAIMAMILAVPGAAWAGEGGDDDMVMAGQGWREIMDGTRVATKAMSITTSMTTTTTTTAITRAMGLTYPHYPGRGPYYPHYARPGPYYPQYYPSHPCSTCGKNNHHNNNNNGNDKLWIGLLRWWHSRLWARAYNTATPPIRAILRRRPARHRRRRPSMQTPHRTIRACSSGSTARRSWSVENR